MRAKRRKSRRGSRIEVENESHSPKNASSEIQEAPEVRDLSEPLHTIDAMQKAILHFASGSVYEPTWREPLKNLFRRPSAIALAGWMLACDQEVRVGLTHSVCFEIANVLLQIADFRDGPLMASRGRGRKKIIAKQGFRVLTGRQPREYRKSLCARADAIEELAILSSSAKRAAQIASGGSNAYSQLVKYAEPLQAEANAWLDVVPRLRAEAKLIGSRGPLHSNESALRGWSIKLLGRALKAAGDSNRIRFIADLLNETKFGSKDPKNTVKTVRRILQMADEAKTQ
jgi:hypothetical protein